MDKEDKRRNEEYKKNPTANLADSINRSHIGDPSQLTKGDFLTRLISSVVIIVILSVIFYFRNK